MFQKLRPISIKSWSPRGVVGQSILWATHWCVAYVAFCRGDLKRCLREHIRGCELLKEYGRPHHRGGWVLEYLEGLETAGMGYPAMTLESELQRLINWPDIFMKGVAYRFRGQKAEKDSGETEGVHSDFEMSLALLTRSGARLELARTQIILARAFSGKDIGKRPKNSWKRHGMPCPAPTQDFSLKT